MTQEEAEKLVNEAAFKSWLQTQDPNTEFEYGKNDDCALCRYMRAMGMEDASVGGNYVRNTAYEIVVYWEIGSKFSFALQSSTYGEVLEKLS